MIRYVYLQGELAIPECNSALSTSRVLTMSFEEGFFVTETDKIAKMKLDSSYIAKIISSIFCEQM